MCTMRFHQKIILLSIIANFYACGAAPISSELTEPLKQSGNPVWVEQGSSTLKSGGERVFLGVGKVSSVGNFSTQATVANQRAREALTDMVTRYLDVLSREFMAANKTSTHLSPAEVENQITKFTNNQIANIDINTYWHSKRDSQIFAAAHLDFPTLKSIISSSADIDQGLKLFINQSGSEVFDRIAIRSQKEIQQQ